MWFMHLGHASVLVASGGTRILFDPGAFDAGWHGTADLDAVVVTHAHPDHVDGPNLPSLLEANPDAAVYAEAQVVPELAKLGIAAATLAPGDTVSVRGLTLTAHGGRHAVIHPDLPRVGNVGVTASAPDEPTFFHPGDSYDTTPAGVDVLAVPLAAPWGRLAEAVDFVRAVAPKVAFPIHDAVLSDLGRTLYLRNLGALGGTDVRDLAGAGEVEINL